MPQLLGLLICDQDKIVLEQFRALFNAVLLRLLGINFLQRHDERILDAKDRI